MKKIFFCGDTHGNFDHVIEAVYNHQPDAVILLGDLQAQRPLEVELSDILDKTDVWFIHGNHDTDSQLDHDNLFESALSDRNLHGKVVTVAGIRIAGLGGVFRGKIWQPPSPAHHASAVAFLASAGRGNRWRNGLPLKQRSTIFPNEYDRLSKMCADVLITHEAPTPHPMGSEALQVLAQKMKATKSFHGHHHDSLDYSAHWKATGVQAFGVGFRGITDLNGVSIKSGEFDVQRMHLRQAKVCV